jgi:hypothetical protein
MFDSPSFFADIMHPSTKENISRAISKGERSWYPSSRVFMNHAFSANRQASKKIGTLCRLQMSLACRRLAMLTGCPPQELFVTVIITNGTW